MIFLMAILKKTRFAQLQSLELIESLFCEVNPIPVKTALNMMGYNFGKSRLPLIDMSKSGKQHFKKIFRKFQFTITIYIYLCYNIINIDFKEHSSVHKKQ
jgi:dapA: dihydrodipicolinate synthase